MRYIQTPVYKFEELSETAKERATSSLNNEHLWADDSIASLEAFAGHFRVKITGWEYSPFGRADIQTNAEKSNFRGFTLKQARALPEYPTGYCLDYSLREAFIKQFESTGDALQAFKDVMEAGIKEMREDWEGQFDPEYTLEHCTSNGYEFDENGNLI